MEHERHALDREAVRRGREILRRAERVVVLTGAGVSADSGVPTFRGEEGLWKRHRPEELATPEAFARDPRLVWEWYAWRRELVAPCEPNAAHRALADWARRRDGVTLVTQNVDGLHGRAADVGQRTDAGTADRPGADGGTPRRAGADPIELHGSLFRVRCTACPGRYPHRDPVDTTSERSLPRCRACGALLRPDVVWFGEPLPSEALRRAFEAAGDAEACLVVGTSGVVFPAAGIATAAAASGATLIEVNPEATALSGLTEVALRARAAIAVPALLAP